MIDTPIRQIIFLMIFCVGLGLMITEGPSGQFTGIMLITAKFIFPVFLGLVFTVNRRMWLNEKKKFVIESLRSAAICSLTVLLFLPTVNRILPPSTDVRVTGKILSIKPGRGNGPNRGREMEILQEAGQVINLTVPHSLYMSATTEGIIRLKCKRGGLGLLYGAEKET